MWKRRFARSTRTNFRRSSLSRWSMDSRRMFSGSSMKPRAREAALAATVAAFMTTLAVTPTSAQQPKLLPPERAFAFSVQAVDENTVEARFAIANGYYLYRDKLKFSVEPVTLAAAPT